MAELSAHHRAELFDLLGEPMLPGSDAELRAVQENRVTRQALVRALIEIKGVHGVPAAGEWAEAHLFDRVPLDRALAWNFLPLVELDGCAYGIAPERGAPDAEALATAGLRPMPVGTHPDLPALVRSLDEVLQRYRVGNRKFGEFLVAGGYVDAAQVERAVAFAGEHGLRLAGALVRLRFLSEELAIELLASFLDLPYYDVARILELADAEVVRCVPRSFARANAILALRREGEAVRVVTSRPENVQVLDDVAKAAHARHAHLAVAGEVALLNLLDLFYEANPEDRMLVELPGETPEAEAQRADVPRLVEYLLLTGVRRRASDIHIECYDDRVELRYRIDGVLHPAPDAPLNLRNVRPVIAAFKVAAGMDIAERRRPQDGAIRRRYREGTVDFRVAAQPTIRGENLVLRILNQTQSVPRLADLGFPSGTLDRFERLIRNPQGLILLTGPTGCGKTTTLYSVLQQLRGMDVKIVTAEDPVEYAIDGIQQSQVHDAIGNTFNRFLRAFLRQDPDVILIGEIRDAETAEMTIRAALTGHLIFSTLHVNEAVGVVRRLTDLGLESNLISQTLLCVVSQRLARRNCARCAAPYQPDADLVGEFYPEGLPAGATFRKGTGCPACDHTGYRGRLALVEYWEPDDAVRALIDRRAETEDLRAQALASGMHVLFGDALEKAEAGLTTLEELAAVVPFEQIVRYRRAVRFPTPA